MHVYVYVHPRDLFFSLISYSTFVSFLLYVSDPFLLSLNTALSTYDLFIRITLLLNDVFNHL